MDTIYSTIGPAGTALVLLACLSLYLSLKNLLYLHFVWRDFNRDFLNIERKRGECLRDVCENSPNPLIAIIRDIVTIHAGHSEDIKAEVAYLFHRNFEGVMKGLCYLRLIAVISPLMGLLGTILGMVTVFQTIAGNAAPDAALLAAGIWEALITTIMGLVVAIPTLMFYYFLMLKFKGFHIEAVEYSYRAIELCAGAKRPESTQETGSARAAHDASTLASKPQRDDSTDVSNNTLPGRRSYAHV